MLGAVGSDLNVGELAVFRTGERPTTRKWATFEHACAQVRLGKNAA